MTKPTTKPSQLTLDINAAYVAQVAEIKRLQAVADHWCQRAIEAEAEIAERESQITRLENQLTETLRLVGDLVQPAEHD